MARDTLCNSVETGFLVSFRKISNSLRKFATKASSATGHGGHLKQRHIDPPRRRPTSPSPKRCQQIGWSHPLKIFARHPAP
jgi:hypothetical protein